MKPHKPECVIALAFGYRRRQGRLTPGDANETLAAVVHRDYAELPKILQLEVAIAFEALDREPVLKIQRHRSDAYLDTHEVLVQAASLCRKSGWETVAMVAHPLHLPRAVRCAEQLGLKTDVDQIARMNSEALHYDTQSEQSWTRSEFGTRVHETLATALYRLLGYI